MAVKSFHPGRSLAALGVIISVLIGGPVVSAENKVIHLRNETISTPPKASVRTQALASEAAASGLFLVQVNGHLTPAWREALRSLRVELLRYVPDDAFVARFQNVSPEQVKSLSFVRWVGPYRPEHKIHPSLRAGNPSRVRILLAHNATAVDAFKVKRLVRRLERGSPSRFGTILHAEITTAQLSALASLDTVLWIEPAPKMKLYDEIASKIVGGDDGTNGTRTVTQQLDFDGRGVRVAVADSGLNNGDAATMHP